MFALQFSRLSTITVGILGLGMSAMGAGLTPGNIVALRTGDGSVNYTSTNLNVAAPVFLDEFTPTASGTRVQSIALTTTSAHLITMAGSLPSNLEGLIHVSSDGQYIIVGGYDCPIGTASPFSSAANVYPRVMAKVKISDGSVDTSTEVTTSGVFGNLRSATSTNGTDFWFSSYPQTTTTLSSIWYTNPTKAGDATDVLAPVATFNSSTYALREVNIFNNQLYCTVGNLSVGAANLNGLYAVGTGVPTSSGNRLTTVTAGMNSPAVFANLMQTAFDTYTSPSIAGQRIWTADNSATLDKWDFDGTNWVKTASFGNGTIGNATGVGTALGKDTSLNDVVFVTVATANPNNAIWMVNRSTAAAVRVAQASTATGTFMLFRGVAVVPTPAAKVKEWSQY